MIFCLIYLEDEARWNTVFRRRSWSLMPC